MKEAIFTYILYGTSFFGCYHFVELTGLVNLTVQGINISPSQAEVIQTDPDYYTDNASGIRTKRRK